MFERILVAVDGSPYSRQAIPIATELAKRFAGDVFALHVFERELSRAAAFPVETPDEATSVITEAVKAFRDAGVNATGEVRHALTGHAAKQIVEAAKEKGSDLIVMGSRGLSDIGGLLLGSVTHKVMQLAHIPVLVVRAPESAAEKEKVGAAAARAGTTA
jgi:nucleotide-binding universal stress UspA family protein